MGAVLAGQDSASRNQATWWLGATVELAGALEVAVDALGGDVASMASRFSLPSRSSTPTSSGNRSTPLASPWVRLAAQKPPLRPDAAQPQRSPSTTHDVPVGSSRLGQQGRPQAGVAAADDDEVRSGGPDERGAVSGAPGSSSQNERGVASANAAVRSMAHATVG